MPPPDARIRCGRGIPAASIRSRPSRSPKATPSMTARTGGAGRGAAVSPTNAPRANGSGCGLRSPVRYGRKNRPSVAGRDAAGGLDERAEVLPGRQGVAEPAQAPGRREHHRHHVPPTGHGVAEGVDDPARVGQRAVRRGEDDAGGPE